MSLGKQGDVVMQLPSTPIQIKLGSHKWVERLAGQRPRTQSSGPTIGALAFSIAVGAVASAEAKAQSLAATPSIEWSVKDRFRLFDRASPADRDRVEQTLEKVGASLAAGRKVADVQDLLLDTLALEGAAGLRQSNFGPHSPDTTQRSGRYSTAYLYPASYRIRVRAAGVTQGEDCRWRVQDVVVLEKCDVAAEVIIPAKLSGDGGRGDLYLTVGNGAEVLAEEIELRDLLVVAMGDSYISGEGNPDVPARYHVKADARFRSTTWPAHLKLGPSGDVTPAHWWDQPCHRSLLSWPVLASFGHAARNPQQAVTLVHLGCSGDEVSDGLLTPRQELPGGGSEYQSQFDMLEKLRARSGDARPVDKLFLSIGGNDVGFAPVIAALLLPPNGWRAGNFLASFAGSKAEAACPYRKENEPRGISRFCGRRTVDKNGTVRDRRSAEERLEELDDRLAQLSQTLKKSNIAAQNVFQITYPNALLDNDLQPCRTAPSDDDIKRIKQRVRWSWLLGGRAYWEQRLSTDQAYAAKYPERVDGGFEGLIAQIKPALRSKRRWRFEIQYFPEPDWEPQLEPAKAPAAKCDWNVERTDSEVCQAYWVWANLNRKIREYAAHHSGWTIVDSHQDAIRPRGWCNARSDYQLRLPLLTDVGWRDSWTPESFNPYEKNPPRWFRTTNDSILTQYESPQQNHKGTMHPNFRAHLEIAAAVLEAAFSEDEGHRN